MKKYPYTTFLIASLCIAAVLWFWFPEVTVRLQQFSLEIAEGHSESISSNGAYRPHLPSEEPSKEEDIERPIEKPIEEPEQKEETEKIEEKEEVEEIENKPFTFDDALFIGDSRTIGLYEYTDLGAADLFADIGMSVYKILSASITMSDGQERSLEQLLTEKSYGKIYIMLGINEIGYAQEKTLARYEELLEHIEQWQPEAEIILQANMHVGPKKNATDAVFNNENINRLNAGIALLAEKGQGNRRYLDINATFDDENGNLRAELSEDGIHLKGKEYKSWKDAIVAGGKN